MSELCGLRSHRRTMWASVAAGMLLATAATVARAADPWTKPTPEELAMTSQAGYPGAAAVVLNREEITRDDMHSVEHYERIKVLTEKGKEYANVELRFAASKADGWWEGDEKSVTEVAGRTVHPDGSVIPFTGKPYSKVLENAKSYKYQARVFTLPDVEIGSIIEYRYTIRISDHAFESPHWYIQGDLFTRAAHYVWYPTTRELTSEEGSVNTIFWYPILPAGAAVVRTQSPAVGPGGSPQQRFEVNVKDVPPAPKEEYMPPLENFTYRVLFYYTAYRTFPEFWKSAGKHWSKRVDSFANPDGALRTATQTVIAGADTQDAKLRKIYAAIMEMENTDFTRDHETTEDKAEGMGKVADAADVLRHKRGSSAQLAETFVGMARAAGMKAYMMYVPDRERQLFTPQWMSFYQFDNLIAIVNVDGKEQFFDPGQRFCPYGRLAWQNTFAKGLRQTENGTDFGDTPGENYKQTNTKRVADLTMDDHGQVSGEITLSYVGASALVWRQQALGGDKESTTHAFETMLAEMLPKSMEVKVKTVENLTDYEKPLTVKFDVKGTMGAPTGKRMILPVDIFLADSAGSFPHDKRELPVYFHYPSTTQDAVRVKFPKSTTVEAVPKDATVMFMDRGQYSIKTVTAPDSVMIRRDLMFNTIIVMQPNYPALRTFYSQLEAKDKESIILKAGAAPAAGGN